MLYWERNAGRQSWRKRNEESERRGEKQRYRERVKWRETRDPQGDNE